MQYLYRFLIAISAIPVKILVKFRSISNITAKINIKGFSQAESRDFNKSLHPLSIHYIFSPIIDL